MVKDTFFSTPVYYADPRPQTQVLTPYTSIRTDGIPTPGTRCFISLWRVV